MSQTLDSLEDNLEQILELLEAEDSESIFLAEKLYSDLLPQLAQKMAWFKNAQIWVTKQQELC